MEKIERLVRVVTHIALAALAAILCVRLCTGCMAIREATSRERIAETMKTAYAEGGREAVSNRIEKLVRSGDLSRKQADKLHELAQGLYDRILEKLEDCDVEACLDCKD